jgi:hypothetical protein
MNEFEDFMNDTITIEPFVSRDSYGTPSYGAAVSYPCRVSAKQKQVVDLSGVERVSMARIYVSGTPAIGSLDRLTLPAGYTPQQPPILIVHPLHDEAGSHHTELTV